MKGFDDQGEAIPRDRVPPVEDCIPGGEDAL